MMIHMQAFINKHGQNAGRVEHQQTDIRRHKTSPVSRWGRSAANVIQGAKQRETNDNSPGWGKQSPNDKTRERSQAGYKLQG